MSIGVGGHAKISAQDDQTVIYEYYAYDLNSDELRNPDKKYDGTITIDKSSLVVGEIHEKIKRFPNGKKKKITKHIIVPVDLSALVSSGKIEVKNSEFCPEIFSIGVGMIAMRIISEIFELYQTEGSLPESVGYHT